METITVHIPESIDSKTVKAVLKALGVSYETVKNGISKKKEKPYNHEFVAKILQGEKDIAEGKGTRIKLEDLWK